ncbi:MAG: hypothetical protein LWY06_02790 [Firmicutes bacterium]|nr:hypothetical protein [Bacillota bacterium]
MEKITEIELHNSPLYELTESADKYCLLKITSSQLREVLKATKNKISDFADETRVIIFDENKLDEFENIYAGIIAVIENMLNFINRPGAEEKIASAAVQLKALNRELILFKRWLIAECRVDDAEQLREMLLDRITDEDVITDKYIEVESMTNAVLEEKILTDEFEEFIDYKRDEITKALDGYDDFYLSKDEWTMETALGDKLLREGAGEYLDSLEMLRESCVAGDQDYAEIALDNLFEANVKLVTVQKLADYVKEQAAIS